MGVEASKLPDEGTVTAEAPDTAEAPPNGNVALSIEPNAGASCVITTASSDEDVEPLSPPPSPARRMPRRPRWHKHAKVRTEPPGDVPPVDTCWGFCFRVVPFVMLQGLKDPHVMCFFLTSLAIVLFALGYTLGYLTSQAHLPLT